MAGSRVTVTLGIQGLPDDFSLPAMTIDDLRGQSATGLIRRVQNQLANIPSFLERATTQMEHLRTERARAQQGLTDQQEFPKQAELDAARARLAGLEKELNPTPPEQPEGVEATGPADAQTPPGAVARRSAAAAATSSSTTAISTARPGQEAAVTGITAATAATARSTTIDPDAGPLTLHDEPTGSGAQPHDPGPSPTRRR
jgi:hypothetical protein